MDWSSFSIIFANIIAVLLLLFFRKDKFAFWMICYCCAMAMLEVFSTWYGHNYGNNWFLFHVNAFLEFALLSFYFKKFIDKQYPDAKFLKIWIPVVLIFITINGFSFRLIELSMTLASVSILVYSFIFFFILLDDKINFENNLHFYFVVTIFLMHSISLMSLLFYNIIADLPEEMKIIFYMRPMVIVITKFIFLSVIVSILGNRLKLLKSYQL